MRLTHTMNQQRGFSLITFIFGMLVGLMLAAGVAFYITKAPLPFVDRFSQQQTPRAPGNWNPNQTLQPQVSDTTAPPPPPLSNTGTPTRSNDPVAIATQGNITPSVGNEQITPQNGTATNPVNTPPTTSGAFYVQAGAFTSASDAEQQRARLAMLGSQATISQGTASGSTVHRVRIGPFATRSEAITAQKNLTSNGIDAGIVTAQP